MDKVKIGDRVNCLGIHFKVIEILKDHIIIKNLNAKRLAKSLKLNTKKFYNTYKLVKDVWVPSR